MQRSGCWCVLSCIESAKEGLAIDGDLKDGDEVPVARLAEYIKDGTNHFICPAAVSNIYSVGRIGQSPRCSFHGSLQELRDRLERGESQ